ncbi:MAG: 16S rRNA (guanine(527)-N(7))-methyltransferase RsmG [Puniceicoccales bacterium]|nr:16S rRNA (guanine(527)-N(7))-methyltransferase RsmG [Puniceicoccales bacterium]
MQISLTAIKHFFPSLSEATVGQLQIFCELVRAKNEHINLISRKDIGGIVERHLLPSLAILKVNPFEAGATALDIGTGGGFPGLALAIAAPHAHFTLVDSIGKKIRAVEEFVGALELKNVTCVNDRIENLRHRYRYVIGRAVASVDVFLRWARSKLAPNGKIFYITGGTIPLQSGGNIIDLFELYQHKFCETKKLLALSVP